MLEATQQLLNLMPLTIRLDHLPTTGWRTLQLRARYAATFQGQQQLRSGDAQHGGDFHQVPEADVLLATFDLANIGSMQSANVSEFLLGPLPSHTKLVDAFTQE